MEKSTEQWLEEKREELGLNMTKSKRFSLQDEDAEPRYEISKMSRLAKKDLDETNHDNLNEQERLYGNGKSIGDDIIEQHRSASQVSQDKQLDNQASQYLKFTSERDTNISPLQDGIRQYNSGHIVKPGAGGHSTSKMSDSRNDVSGMLPGLNNVRGEYNTVFCGQKRMSSNAMANSRSYRLDE